jgi:paraquat-inducible protein B
MVRDFELLVEKGLRARLQTGNLLTGQLYVALDFIPDAPKAKVDWSRTIPVLPTVPSSLQSLQQTVESITRKIDRLPIEQIGTSLAQTLQGANALMLRLDKKLAPEASRALADVRTALQAAERVLASESPLQQDARAAMREMGKAAQAFRVLADYLERHPEALLRGKPEDPQ